MNRTCLCLLTSSLISAHALATTHITQVVVLPVKLTKGVEIANVPLLDDMLLTELSKANPAQVRLIGAKDVAAMVGVEMQRQLAGCGDSGCLIEVGNALGASHLVTVSLGRIGRQLVLNGALLDVKETRTLFRDSLYLGETEESIIGGMRDLAKNLAASPGWQEGIAWTRAESVQNKPINTVELKEQSPAIGTTRVALLVAGALTTAVGVALAGGLGATAYALNGYVKKNSLDRDVRAAAWGGIAAIGGAALGAVTVVAGGALLAVGIINPKE
jgi:hypothetical protein